MLSRGRVVHCVCLHGIAIRGTRIRTVAETALITELTHALFEEATSDDNRVMGWRCLVDTCIISVPLHMPIPTVISLATRTILEVPKIKTWLFVMARSTGRNRTVDKSVLARNARHVWNRREIRNDTERWISAECQYLYYCVRVSIERCHSVTCIHKANLSISIHINLDRAQAILRGEFHWGKHTTRETLVTVPYRQAILCVQLSAIFSFLLRRNDDRRRVVPWMMSWTRVHC